MKLIVTKEDIAEGKPCDSDCCPVALAFKRLYPGCSVSVGPSLATVFSAGEHLTTIALPDIVRDKIVRFDKTHFITPFEVEL